MKACLWFSRTAVLFLSVSFIATTALASQITITGTADKGYSQDENFSISGPGLTLISDAVDGPSEVSLSSCSSIGIIVCGLVIRASQGPQEPGNFGGSLNGVGADFLIGSLIFSLAPGFPMTPIPIGSSASGPVSVTGDIIGVNLIPPFNTLGPPLFEVLINGTGTLTANDLRGCAQLPCYLSSPTAAFLGFNFTFTGTATPTPEPANLILLGTGMLGLGAIGLKRRAKPLK